MTNREELTNREIDALVAEKIMGWTREPDKTTDWQETPWYEDCIWTTPCGQLSKIYPPNYSTSIEAAWEVVEKLISDGYTWDLNSHVEWRVRVANYRDGQTRGVFETHEIGITLPRAICLAALKAVGEEQEK